MEILPNTVNIFVKNILRHTAYTTSKIMAQLPKEAQELAQQINSAANDYAQRLQALHSKQGGLAEADSREDKRIINAIRLLRQDPSNPVPSKLDPSKPRRDV